MDGWACYTRSPKRNAPRSQQHTCDEMSIIADIAVDPLKLGVDQIRLVRGASGDWSGQARSRSDRYLNNHKLVHSATDAELSQSPDSRFPFEYREVTCFSQLEAQP